ISACGRFVAFHSFFKIFVRDREVGTTERIDVDDHGQGGNGGAYYHSAISGDGRYVAFRSLADNLAPGDTNGGADVFVRDRLSGTTTLISVTGAGRRGLVSTYDPGLSADGRYAVFDLFGPGLAPDGTGYPAYRISFIERVILSKMRGASRTYRLVAQTTALTRS
ncbi:MAG: hypothetical protein GY715_15790, partial [Planctomycetes bacterium]|nr:hypothetical protein [Planctomycetota bacterium]